MKTERFTHACNIFDSVDDTAYSALPWLASSLKLRRRVLLLIEADRREFWRNAFLAFGIDDPADLSNLVFHEPLSDEPGNEFNSLRTARYLWSLVEELQRGYAGVAVLIDMGWTNRVGLQAEDLCHWEATLEHLLSGVANVQVMCMYDRPHLPVSTLHAALRTHAISIYKDHFAANAFCEASQILEKEPDVESCSTDPALVERMLRQIHPRLI